jgi:hypothetical protein
MSETTATAEARRLIDIIRACDGLLSKPFTPSGADALRTLQRMHLLCEQAANAVTAANTIERLLGEETPVSRWQLIDTAPDNGARFIAKDADHHRITWWGKTSHVPLYGWCHGRGEDIDLWQPTHWAPPADHFSIEETERVSELLEGRDKFIVESGLWERFAKWVGGR